MRPTSSRGLNDSGENLITRIVESGAVHVSNCERTHAHAHYAWKVMVGLDAPISLRCAAGEIRPEDDVRVVVVPPGLHHELGALGWSCAMFTAPGTRGSPWHGRGAYWVPEPRVARRVVTLGRQLALEERLTTSHFIDAVYREVFDGITKPTVDARVRRVLECLDSGAETLLDLASTHALSPDRLSHLVKQETGMPLRKHLVWSRLMALLSTGQHYPTLAAAAAAAGFSDHAHLTRTYRSYLGRLPSDFSGPPDVVQPW